NAQHQNGDRVVVLRFRADDDTTHFGMPLRTQFGQVEPAAIKAAADLRPEVVDRASLPFGAVQAEHIGRLPEGLHADRREGTACRTCPAMPAFDPFQFHKPSPSAPASYAKRQGAAIIRRQEFASAAGVTYIGTARKGYGDKRSL